MRAILFVLKLLPPRLRNTALVALLAPPDPLSSDLDVTIAETADELEESARLVHDTYVERGLMDAQPNGVRLTPHHLSPSTTVFVARSRGELVGTLALMRDSAIGLPMERVFPTELRQRRRGRRRVAEVGSLAVARAHRRTGVTYLLYKTMWRSAVELLDVDDLVMAVHPAACDAYRATLFFSSIGPVRSYPGLNRSALATPMHLDLRSVEKRLRRAFGHLRPTSRNPYHLYIERREPQIRVPAREEFELGARRRLEAIRALAERHPEVTRALTRAPRARRPSTLTPMLSEG